MKKSINTFLKHTAKDFHNQSVNPPVVRASTIIFKSLQDIRKTQKKYKKDPNEENKNLVKTSLSNAFSLIDKAVKKNVLHKNNGANKKSKINKFVKTALVSK